MSDRERPVLAGLSVGDSPAAWKALGFMVSGAECRLTGVTIRLGSDGHGITSWALAGVPPTQEVDGLTTRVVAAGASSQPVQHPNGALGLDHVVIVSPDFDRTAAALEKSGLALSRVRDGGGFRQGFRRIGPAILELVEARRAPPGPASFWGLVVTVEDLDELARRLGDRLGRIHAAVQSGRRIATLRADADISLKLAFMTPEPA